MKKFVCSNCGGRVFFENSTCLSCGFDLGFIPNEREIATFASTTPSQSHQRIGGTGNYRRCGNALGAGACNWMISADSPGTFCMSCSLNHTIPDLNKPQNQQAWLKLETAKRRLIYSLLSLRLPVPSKAVDPINGLAFDFLEDPPPGQAGNERIFTGHTEGLITINLDEADDPKREKIRQRMGEMYRTVLGHFRHEIGHFYWDILIRDTNLLEKFRGLFGDERADYNSALESNYHQGPPPNWQMSHVSAYAASHPWEDWAESWAHYLHILDTLDTAAAEGLTILDGKAQMIVHSPIGLPFSDIAAQWRGVRLLLNGLNRSMGLPDPYPFVLADTVIEKLTAIHEWVAAGPPLK